MNLYSKCCLFFNILIFAWIIEIGQLLAKLRCLFWPRSFLSSHRLSARGIWPPPRKTVVTYRIPNRSQQSIQLWKDWKIANILSIYLWWLSQKQRSCDRSKLEIRHVTFFLLMGLSDRPNLLVSSMNTPWMIHHIRAILANWSPLSVSLPPSSEKDLLQFWLPEKLFMALILLLTCSSSKSELTIQWRLIAHHYHYGLTIHALYMGDKEREGQLDLTAQG